MARKKSPFVLLMTDWIPAVAAVFWFGLLRLFPTRARADLASRFACAISPMLSRNRTARDNLTRAFPEKSEHDRRRILAGMWDNLARTLAEYGDLDNVIDFDPSRPEAGNIEVTGVENFIKLRNQRQPAIIFAAHLANWEVLPLIAAKLGLEVSLLFRKPNSRFVARRLFHIRAPRMGDLIESKRGAALQLAAELERGGRVGLLVDQRFHGGIPVRFFGRLADTNPLLAKLARRYDCPVHGARVIRLANRGFRVEITDEIGLPRDAEGQIDVVGATARITEIVEGWIREHPDQWLWLHQRWRLGRKSRIPFRHLLKQQDPTRCQA